ncbi:class I SAM-dependent methyltransferase [Oceanirhabdus sp. W0125-5]|uniref:class I SAM-dependent methyltransferase n=1 Tax=Oceanirhabdus sp. W0125-5 TaxID=2999116 RepID=UPI0022F30ED1|nr:class I SAM-dependent methyltransferase [Oceanirhabdus sp. W0125-5]WBW95805.1 class I SAM-dependent methyltransferase [Oceanirhabdus sp. W0125-5]
MLDGDLKEITDWWDRMSSVEEVDYDDEYVNRQLRWREILRNLKGIKTILDVGGATGVFSIPLAKAGFKVTHLDISDKMLKTAKNKADKLGINNITFIKGDASDLNMFKDGEFDLVLNQDGPISFSGVKASKVIGESCRVTKKRLIVSVSNKACMTATWLNYSMKTLKDMSPSVVEMMDNGMWEMDKYHNGEDLCTINELKAFSCNELKDELEKNGMKVSAVRSIGSLTHMYLIHLYRQHSANEVKKMMDKLSKKEEFIELCERYDIEVMPDGPGSFRRAGIIGVCEKIS